MAEVNINLKCDLQHAVKVQYLDGNLFSQDAAANTINIEVTDGGAPAEIGGTVSANVIRPDGGTVEVTGGTIDGNTVSITLPAACYALVGMITIVVKLTDESTVTTLAALVAYVYQSSTDTVVDPGTVVSSIQDLIDAIDTAVASIPADYSSLWTKLAPAFSSSTAYTAGQYVTYNSGLYRFTKTHAAGSWASGDVVAVNIGGELSDVKSAIIENHNYENNVNEVLGKQTGERQVFWYSSTNVDPEHAHAVATGNVGGVLSFQYASSHAVLKIKNPWIARITLPITESAAIAQVFIVRDSDEEILGRITPSQTEEVSIDVYYTFRSDVTYYINWYNAYTDQSVFPQYCYFLYEDDNPYDFLSKYSPFLESSTMFGDYGVTRDYLFSNCLVRNGWVSVGTNGTMNINNPAKPASHRHLLISSRNIKKITLTGGSAAPAVHYGFWFEDPINGGQTQAILGAVAEPTYTFAIPTDGYIAFNNFGNGDYATGFEIEYWSVGELSGGNKRYHNSVRKPFAFSGKTAVFTGDSITAGFTSGTTTTQNGYPKLFSEAVGMTFTNAGVGGATIARVSGYSCIQDQVANASKTIDFLFIAGGVNDWQLNVAFDTFEAAVETLCQYINNNFPATTKVIWITPINHAGWDITHPAIRAGNVQDYRNMLTRVVTMNDTLSRFSIVQGDEFNFPTADDAESYWSVAFGDRLHPSELGYKNIYTPGLLNALE